MQIKIDDLIITIEGPRPDCSYAAWFGDYDLDCMEGWGKTEISACADLLDKYNDYLQTRLINRLRERLNAAETVEQLRSVMQGLLDLLGDEL